MKHLSILFALLMACVSARAQTPYELDIDAESYCRGADLKNQYNIQRIHQFYNAIKNLNLQTNMVLASTFRDGYCRRLTASAPSMIGSSWSIVDKVPLGQDGFLFDGTMTQYLEVDNPIKGTAIDEYTIAIAYQSASLLPTYCLFSGSDYANNLRGPAIYLNGCKDDQVGEFSSLYHYKPTSGSDDPSGWPANSKSADSNNGGPQIVFATFKSTGTPVFNNGNKWRLGRDFDAPAPLPFGYQGIIAGIFVWNKSLNISEISTFRYLYERTLGEGFVSRVKSLMDSDGTTWSSGVYTWMHHLGTNAVWSFTDRKPRPDTRMAIEYAQNRLDDYILKSGRDLRYAMKSYYITCLGYDELFINGDYTTGNGYGNSVDEVWARLSNLYKTARAAGMTVVACTVPYTHRATKNPYSYDPDVAWKKLEALNKKIRDSNGLWDRLVELDKIPQLQVSKLADTLNTKPPYYYDDGLLTTEGNRLIAEKIATTLGNPLR